MYTWIEISKDALQANFREFSNIAGKEKLAPVIKSNAYGHGFEQVYTALSELQPKWISVTYVSEGLSLRRMGFKGSILNVGPVFQTDFADAESNNIDIFLTNHAMVGEWLALDRRPKGHLKIDTGLSRQGFLLDDLPDLLDQLIDAKADLHGICTHFANVEDVLEHEYATLQLTRFEEATKLATDKGFKLKQHASSSASTLILDHSRLDLCRVGVSMYGLWPSQPTRLSFLQETGRAMELKPALSWKTKVHTVKKIKSGSYVGYGCTFRAPQDMTIAILPVGYFEGYPRLAASAHSFVLIGGRRCSLVGRISMNIMAVDVSHLDSVSMDDEVVLIGKQGEDQISAADLSEWSQTIHYELLTRLNPSIPRQLVP